MDNAPLKLTTLAVVGAGTMGLGIAQLGVQHGFPTILFDLNPAALTKAKQSIAAGLSKLVEKNKLSAQAREEALARLTCTTELARVKADLIVEAVVERLDVKHQLFLDLAGSTRAASGTGSWHALLQPRAAHGFGRSN
jgi:3-hydroxybutyryl-CoA dehydrogenase